MPAPNRLARAGRSIRFLRLVAGLAVIVGLVAVWAIVKGGPAGRSQTLIAAALILGAAALLGMAILAWPYRQKEKNDPRP